jgi:hypothetical protein
VIPAAGDVVLRYEIPCDGDGTLSRFWYLNLYVTFVGDGDVDRQCRGAFAVLDFLECTESRQTLDEEFTYDGQYCTPPGN